MVADLAASDARWAWVGDPNATVLVAGHSHRAAYRAAADEGLAPGVAVLVPAGPANPSAPSLPDDSYWRVAREAPGRVLVVTWRGNQHNVRFLFEAGEPIRLHDCGELGRVVPASMISAFWEQTLEGIEAAVASARAEHVVLVGTPPPKTEEAIRASLLRASFFASALAEAGETAQTIRLTPPEVLTGLWKILQADLAAQASRVGAIFVPVPRSAQTAEGFLKPEYSLDDATHANAAFGALMLSEIETSLARVEAGRR